ncbi:hypothetical protein CR513_43865, partial [Mucuna pruriens]
VQPRVMDLYLTLVMDERPQTIVETSTDADKLSLNLMRLTMTINAKPFMPKVDFARKFMKLVKEYS